MSSLVTRNLKIQHFFKFPSGKANRSLQFIIAINSLSNKALIFQFNTFLPQNIQNFLTLIKVLVNSFHMGSNIIRFTHIILIKLMILRDIFNTLSNLISILIVSQVSIPSSQQSRQIEIIFIRKNIFILQPLSLQRHSNNINTLLISPFK